MRKLENLIKSEHEDFHHSNGITMNLENLFGQQNMDDNYLFLTRLINDNLDKNRLCRNCRWNKDTFCSIEFQYIVEEVDSELRTCEGWEYFIPSTLILRNHIQ